MNQSAIDLLEKFVEELYALREDHLAKYRAACAAKDQILMDFHSTAASVYMCGMVQARQKIGSLRLSAKRRSAPQKL